MLFVLCDVLFMIAAGLFSSPGPKAPVMLIGRAVMIRQKHIAIYCDIQQ